MIYHDIICMYIDARACRCHGVKWTHTVAQEQGHRNWRLAAIHNPVFSRLSDVTSNFGI